MSPWSRDRRFVLPVEGCGAQAMSDVHIDLQAARTDLAGAVPHRHPTGAGTLRSGIGAALVASDDRVRGRMLPAALPVAQPRGSSSVVRAGDS